MCDISQTPCAGHVILGREIDGGDHKALVHRVACQTYSLPADLQFARIPLYLRAKFQHLTLQRSHRDGEKCKSLVSPS